MESDIVVRRDGPSWMDSETLFSIESSRIKKLMENVNYALFFVVKKSFCITLMFFIST